MKVRITDGSECWYDGYVGGVFEVLDHVGEAIDYYIIKNGKYGGFGIHRNHCEVIDETVAKEGVMPIEELFEMAEPARELVPKQDVVNSPSHYNAGKYEPST